MIEYENIDYLNLVDFLDKNREAIFDINLYNEKKTCGKIEICRHSIYDSYPIRYDILIRSHGLINFRLENYTTCLCYIENIHSQKERIGVGSILFDIMYDSMLFQTQKLELKLEEICGTLCETHYESGDWLKSIPFYIKQAYKRDLPIIFHFEKETIIINKQTHPQYLNKEDARTFAKDLMKKTRKIAFSIIINKTNDLVCDQ